MAEHGWGRRWDFMESDCVISTILKTLCEFCVDCIKEISFGRINFNGNVKTKQISNI